MTASNPPYFDGLLTRLEQEDQKTINAFGRHVHWGYWEDPSSSACTADQYGEAAEALCRKLCDNAHIEDGMRVLDVGCGFGGTIASLNERFSNMQFVGVNIDERQLERARKCVQSQHNNSIEFIQGDAADIPIHESIFDAIVAVECVFHFDRSRFFSEASRLLRPGGSLTLSDFVPSERALEYVDPAKLTAEDSIRWSYGDLDLTYTLQRYRDIANANDLVMNDVIDITKNTMPTYDFLYSSTDHWESPEQIDKFTRATRLLEKACRSQLIAYQILSFQRKHS